jgi:hypothetical protein
MGWPLAHVRKAASTSAHGNGDNSLVAVLGTRSSVGDLSLVHQARGMPSSAPMGACARHRHPTRSAGREASFEVARQCRAGGIRRAAGGTAKW